MYGISSFIISTVHPFQFVMWSYSYANSDYALSLTLSLSCIPPHSLSLACLHSFTQMAAKADILSYIIVGD